MLVNSILRVVVNCFLLCIVHFARIDVAQDETQ